LLSIGTKIKAYKTVILLVLYGSETWPHTLREEDRLKVFENGMLGLRGTRLRAFGEDSIMRSFMVCTLHPIIFGAQIENEMGGGYSRCEGQKSCMQGFREETGLRGNLEDLGIDGKVILKWILLL
jgi:hypothetical protein